MTSSWIGIGIGFGFERNILFVEWVTVSILQSKSGLIFFCCGKEEMKSQFKYSIWKMRYILHNTKNKPFQV